MIKLLRFGVTQKASQLALLLFSFFSISFLSVFGRTYKIFFAYNSSSITQDRVIAIGMRSLDTMANAFLEAIFIVKFRMCEHDIPFALEKGVMVDLSESMWNPVLQPLKALYLHYDNAYGHQTWQGVNLP